MGADHRPRWLDAAAAAAVLVAGAATIRLAPDPGERALDIGALPFVVMLAAAAALARHVPWPAVVAGALALAGYTAADYLHGPLLVSGVVLVVLVSLVRPWWQGTLAGAALGAAVVDWFDWAAHGQAPWAAAAGLWQALGVVVAAGAAVALPVLAAEVVKQRRVRAVEREQALAAAREREIAQQRLSLAQDVHDTVAHALSVITVQARAGLREAGDGPGSRRLQVISDVAGASVDDLAVLVRDLRGDPARSPQPTLQDLPELVAQAARSGQQVHLDALDGDSPAVPATVGTVGYRVVQESLTNARRHAPGADTHVTVSTTQGLSVLVRNGPAPGGPARPAAEHGPGMGLAGMRERVTGTGGDLHAGPTDGGGWQVHARWATA